MEGITLQEHFATLEDPRVERTKRHQLLAIIAIALCAVICGADTWVDVEEFGKSKRAWLETFLELPNGIPSHDTFGRVFARLDPEQFQACFLSWVQAINAVLPTQQIALDGKTARRSHQRAEGKAAMQMVSAWAEARHLVLGKPTRGRAFQREDRAAFPVEAVGTGRLYREHRCHGLPCQDWQADQGAGRRVCARAQSQSRHLVSGCRRPVC
jgi:hypothetical protein